MTPALIHRLVRFAATCLLLPCLTAFSQTWEDISANVPGEMSQQQFATMASDGTRLYVLGQQGVFASSDNGNTFTAINAVSGGGPDLSQHTQRFIKFVNGELWVGGVGFVGSGLPAAPRLHRLTPGETVWQPSAGGLPGTLGEGTEDDLAYDPDSGNYFGTISTGTVYVSTDGGNNWLPRANGLGGIGSPSSVVHVGEAVLTSRPLAGALKTTDQGLNWAGSQSFGQESIGNMIEQNGRLLITAGRTLHFSDDAGEKWHQVPNVPHGNSVLSGDGAIVVALSRNNTAQEVIAYSASGGLTWHELPRDGLPPIPSFSGYFVQYLFRHGDFLFLRGITLDSSFMMESTQLHRLDASDFDFLNEFEIVIQPQDKGLLVGQSHTLEVYASGEDLTYQWQKNGEDLPEETGRTLLLDNVATTQSGDYTVLVQSGDAPEVASEVAAVTVFERAEGRWDPVFDQTDIRVGGRVHLLPGGEAIVVRTDTTSLSIYRIGADGGRLQSSSTNTSTANNRSNSLIDAEGRIVVGMKPASNTTAMRRYSTESFELQSSLFFPPNTTANRISEIVEVPGRGYAVVGGFSQVGTASLEDFALIGYDNVPVASFPIGDGPNFNTGADSVTVDSDGNIYVAGSFSAWSGVDTPLGLVRFDPEGNVSPVPLGLEGLPVGSRAYFVRALSAGRILIAVGNQNVQTLHALKADGTRDEAFNTAGHTVTDLRRVAQQTDGKIIVVGGFTSYGGVEAAGFVRLNTDGTVDESLYTASGFSSGTINDVTYDPRGYIYLSTANTGGSSNATFQGQGPVGRGPVRIFTTAPEPAPTGYPAWPELASLPEDQRGPEATPAGDGVANLLKYALGVAPMESAFGRLPATVFLVEHQEALYPAITFIRAKVADEVTLAVEVAATLGFADGLGSTLMETQDLGNGSERVTLRSNASVATQPIQFFRLRASES